MQRLVTNDVARLEVGGALYGVMCNEAGGIVDDVVVYRDAGGYMVVINAACRPKDVAWMGDHSARLHLRGRQRRAWRSWRCRVLGRSALVSRLCADDVAEVRPFHCDGHAGGRGRTRRSREPATPARTASSSTSTRPTLRPSGTRSSKPAPADGLIPCGLGARDTLRLEAGLRLYGQDMDDDTDPYSCALGLDRQAPEGRVHRAARRWPGSIPSHPPRRFVGIELQGRAIARHGQRVLAGGEAAGEVTSGTYSFTLDHSIATASLDGDVPADAELSVDIRGTVAAATVVPLPFYRRPKGA